MVDLKDWYTFHVQYYEGDINGYVGTCSEFPGLNVRGDTEQQAYDGIVELVKGIEACEEDDN